MVGERDSFRKRSHSQSDYDNVPSKRRREEHPINTQYTFYQYLCPVGKIGSIIGKGGAIVKQLERHTNSKVSIGPPVPNCEARVVTIHSISEATNAYGDNGAMICPAQDALLRIHKKVVAKNLRVDRDPKGRQQATARLLVPSDQIAVIIGREGKVVRNIRSETGATISITKDHHLPVSPSSSDQLVQVSGSAECVKNALYQIASHLHHKQSLSQHFHVNAIVSYPTYPVSPVYYSDALLIYLCCLLSHQNRGNPRILKPVRCLLLKLTPKPED